MLQSIYDILPAHVIFPNEPMSRHTTFRIGGNADMLIIPENRWQLIQLIEHLRGHEIPWLIIGNGSNLLVKDRGIRGVVIKTSSLNEHMIEGAEITAECGITLEELAQYALTNSLTGIEFAEGIPGTLGGAVFMNAGAYDGEMKDIVVQSEVLNPEGEVQILEGDMHSFGYRSSLLQTEQLIHLASIIHLKPATQEIICSKMNELHRMRWDKQPMELPSGGSVFKRPHGFFVGKLIDECGLRGYRMGDAQISEKHCGFIVNVGNATAADVLNLIHFIQVEVWKRFQVELTPELRVLGE